MTKQASLAMTLDCQMKMEYIPIETKRLILRNFTEQDCESVYRNRSDAVARRFCYGDTYSPEDAKDWVTKDIEAQKESPRKQYELAVVLKEKNLHIGMCGLVLHDYENKQGWTGFTINEKHRRKGYAFEALKAMLDFGFGKLDLHRVSAICEPDNLASARVFEKAGFRREGHCIKDHWVNGRWVDSYIYAILEEEW